MNILDAVKEVLIEAGHELSTKEIAEQVICKGLWSSRGKTPDATIGARIYVDIKRNPNETPFVNCGHQTFGLKSYTQEKKDTPTQQTKTIVKKEKQKVKSLSFTDAAFKVLDVYGKRQPMHYKNITTIAIKEGWLISNG